MKKTLVLCLFGLAVAACPAPVAAHTFHSHETDHPVVFDEAYRSQLLADFAAEHSAAVPALTASTSSGPAALHLAAMVLESAKNGPPQSAPFLSFAPAVTTRWDKDFLYVESNGLPAHNMMVGITAWQQQVPLPQAYLGENAWRIPLHPVPAKKPAVIEGHFLRGAIALAVNGIPIFNPQNNRGEISYEIGELDQWGGHCGRADDYHYHIAPLHLQTAAGKGMPIAYALDGYPIYGLTELDGTPVGKLDECHGHEDAKIGYHYHASSKRPYMQSAFHGEVVEAEGQVDPQPRAQPVREALPGLRGAKITDFQTAGGNGYKLSYEVNGDKRSISYAINSDGTFTFEFNNGRDGTTKEVYSRRGGGGGPPRGPGVANGKGKGKGREAEDAAGKMTPPPASRPEQPKQAGIVMDRNGDGVVSALEFAMAAKEEFALHPNGGTLADALQKARETFDQFDHNRDGILDRPELEEMASNSAPPSGGPPPRRDEEPAGGMKRPEGGGGPRGGKKDEFVASPDQPRSSDGTFLLTSSEVEDLKEMPKDYSGDGSGATLPLSWKGAPSNTKGYALIMDHSDPEGNKKWYWTVYDIPANVTSFPKNVQGIGKVGTGFKGQIGYEPPHSKGPGPKTYVLTMYALSAPLNITQSPREVNREVLVAAMKGKILASSSLRVVHTSAGSEGAGRPERPRPRSASNEPPARNEPTPMPAGGVQEQLASIFATQGGAQMAQNAGAPADGPPPSSGEGKGKGKGKGDGKGGPDNKGLIKPRMDDTIKVNVYADNWFVMFINGELVAVDSIKFTPHNVVSVDILPEYPMTIAIMAKDNADPKTGLEYGDHIGDGGFIIKFADGTVSNAKWKAKNFFKGPLNHDAANPKAEHTPIPDGWWKTDFDDSQWPNATEYTEERVNPKEPYFNADFKGATFIWSEDLDLDNTVIFRYKVEKPGWTKRWNTTPDLDVSGAPFK